MIIHGKCPQLYAHSLEDSACIFVLNAKKQEHTYACYLRDSYLRMDSQEEMTAFVKDVAPSFQRAYAKLYSYVIAFL